MGVHNGKRRRANVKGHTDLLLIFLFYLHLINPVNEAPKSNYLPAAII